MSSAVLRLRTLINEPTLLDFSRDMVELDQASPPTLLVYGEELANALLRSDAVITFDLVAHWKAVVREAALPAIETLFQHTPFFLSGEQHRAVRKTITQTYRRIYAALDDWLPEFTKNFFASYEHGSGVAAHELVASYISQVFDGMLSREVGTSPGELTKFLLPERPLFLILPDRKTILDYESALAELTRECRSRMVASGLDTSELYPLVSVAVMGQEPMYGGLVYGLLNPPGSGRWDGHALLRESAPVSLLGRKIVKDVELNGYQFRKGQAVHISPFLVNQNTASQPANKTGRPSLEFGAGVHLCSGRNISIKIADSFFSEWSRVSHIQLETSGIRFMRDFTLVVKESTE